MRLSQHPAPAPRLSVQMVARCLFSCLLMAFLMILPKTATAQSNSGPPALPPGISGQADTTFSSRPTNAARSSTAQSAAVGAQQTTINFDNLAIGIVVTNQYPQVTFSSDAGEVIVTRSDFGIVGGLNGLGSSAPNYICTAAASGGRDRLNHLYGVHSAS
jgi:hypothetical protein